MLISQLHRLKIPHCRTRFLRWSSHSKTQRWSCRI